MGRRGFRSRPQIVVLGLALVLVLSACASGRTGEATEVTDRSAVLTGTVGDVGSGTVRYWFEYGTTTSYGSETPRRTVEVPDARTRPSVLETVDGLAGSTTYHLRLCARNSRGRGICGGDRTFTTTAGRDSVTGTGTVLSIPELGYAYGAELDASSDPDGTDPRGRGLTGPGALYFRLVDAGDVTCLQVDGNRATIGFEADPVDFGQPPETPTPSKLVFVEDNGPAGDRLNHRTVAEAPTVCPAATDADFAPLPIGGGVPPILTTGDFVVRDAPVG